MNTPEIRVLIPAAGQGTRFGGSVLKQYLPVCGIAVLAHTIRIFQFHPALAGITVVVIKEDQLFKSSLGVLASTVETVAGGNTRAQSVRNGLQHIADQHPATQWVLVHDAARPCLPPECLDRLLEQGIQHKDGAILAFPVGDTLKRAGAAQEIIGTLDRSDLWRAQTPQLFRLAELIQAMDKAEAAGQKLTDEASAIEFAGGHPKLVMGSAVNIKITHPGDLVIAEVWLGQKQK